MEAFIGHLGSFAVQFGKIVRRGRYSATAANAATAAVLTVVFTKSTAME